jgi:hypothetical protein
MLTSFGAVPTWEDEKLVSAKFVSECEIKGWAAHTEKVKVRLEIRLRRVLHHSCMSQ